MSQLPFLLLLPMGIAYSAVVEPVMLPVLRLNPSSEVVAAGSVWTCAVHGAARGTVEVLGLPGATRQRTASGATLVVWQAPADGGGYRTVRIAWHDVDGRVREQRMLTLVLAPAVGGAG